VLGGGSAGFLAAISIRNRRPDLDVRVLRLKDIPIIGVGEGTTTAILRALHSDLRIDPKEFYDEVKPIRKLRIHYLEEDLPAAGEPPAGDYRSPRRRCHLRRLPHRQPAR